MSKARPLSGVTILSIEQLMALPFGTQILADLGAEVIAVSALKPIGDEGVSWRERTGRHKRQISIKLNDPAGQALLRDLARQADVVAENFRPGVMDRYGLGWEAMKAVNPRLIYASVSGYGHKDFLPSPDSELAAYGSIGEAMSGIVDALRRPKGFGAPFALGDISSSIFATIGILAALRHRDLTGEGQYVDVAMADSLLAIAEVLLTRHMQNQIGGGAPQLPAYPLGIFSARDGDIYLIVLNPRHWETLCALIGRAEWITDSQLADREGRLAAMETTIVPAVNAWLGAMPRTEALEKLRAAGLASAPVNTPADIAKDPHYAARRMLQTIVLPGGKELQVVASPIKLSGDPQPTEPVVVAPPNAHTRAVLLDRFGIGTDRYEKLLAEGVLAPDTLT